MNIYMQLYLSASLVWFLAEAFVLFSKEIDKLRNPHLYCDPVVSYNYICPLSYLSLLTTLPFINVITAEIIIVDKLNKHFKLR